MLSNGRLWPFESCIQLFRERLSEKLCTRQSRKAWQGVMGCRYMYKSLYFSLSYVYGGPQLSRQNQKGHGETKNLTAKTKYLTAKPKTSRQKQNTSWQNQKPHGKNKILYSKNKIALVLPWVFAFAVRYLVFAVEYLVLP